MQSRKRKWFTENVIEFAEVASFSKKDTSSWFWSNSDPVPPPLIWKIVNKTSKFCCMKVKLAMLTTTFVNMTWLATIWIKHKD